MECATVRRLYGAVCSRLHENLLYFGEMWAGGAAGGRVYVIDPCLSDTVFLVSSSAGRMEFERELAG